MPIPEPTRDLVVRMKRTALLLDAVASQAKSERAYAAANDAANCIWLAIHRIEDLAQVIEDMAHPFRDEPDQDARV
jgi:hypothetical protein